MPPPAAPVAAVTAPRVAPAPATASATATAARVHASSSAAAPAAAGAPAPAGAAQPALRKLIVAALSAAPARGLSTTALQESLRDKATPAQLSEALNALVHGREAEYLRSAGPTATSSLVYIKLIPIERVAKIRDLTDEEMGVLAIIDKSGDRGVWVRNIKMQTKLQQAHITKMLKKMEGRRLVKKVQSVAYKHRRMYMAYDVEPARDLSGGIWYTNGELDVDFIASMRSTVLDIMQQTSLCTPRQILKHIKANYSVEALPSSTSLTHSDIASLMDSLVWEGLLDYEDGAVVRAVAAGRLERAIFRVPVPKPSGKSSRAAAAAGIALDYDDAVNPGLPHAADKYTAAGGDPRDPAYLYHFEAAAAAAAQEAALDETTISFATKPATASAKRATPKPASKAATAARPVAVEAPAASDAPARLKRRRLRRDSDVDPVVTESDDDDASERPAAARSGRAAVAALVVENDASDGADKSGSNADSDDDDDDAEESGSGSSEGPGSVTSNDSGAGEGLHDPDRRYVLLQRQVNESAATSFPCGLCPVARTCAPGGIVAPETCVYFTQWLDL